MVSMIIVTRERGQQLSKSLRRLLDLTPPDEIVLVDDGSETRHVHGAAENFMRQFMPIKYVYNHRPGGFQNPCQPRNAALKMAAYDEILVTEPELMFMTDVVAQMVAAREQYPDAILSEAFAYHEPSENVTLDQCNIVPGFYSHLIKKQWIMDVGGWDEDIPGPWGHDDTDLYGRLERVGHSIALLPEVRVRHQWHPSRIEPAVENETYLRSKEFPRDIVANQGRKWGQLAR